MELTTCYYVDNFPAQLFMMSKIQNLNGTHNCLDFRAKRIYVVYDVKDTKIVSNSQRQKQRYFGM